MFIGDLSFFEMYFFACAVPPEANRGLEGLHHGSGKEDGTNSTNSTAEAAWFPSLILHNCFTCCRKLAEWIVLVDVSVFYVPGLVLTKFFVFGALLISPLCILSDSLRLRKPWYKPLSNSDLQETHMCVLFPKFRLLLHCVLLLAKIISKKKCKLQCFIFADNKNCFQIFFLWVHLKTCSPNGAGMRECYCVLLTLYDPWNINNVMYRHAT